jgi:hypothetical protein
MGDDTPADAVRERVWWRRLGWMVLLWVGGVATVGLVALAFRAIMGAVGLTR